MINPRIAATLNAVIRAKAKLEATGETRTINGGGRAPTRSEVYLKASAEVHAAKQARNRLFVELVGDSPNVPSPLIKQFGMTGREAAHIVDTARAGSQLLKEFTFGSPAAKA